MEFEQELNPDQYIQPLVNLVTKLKPKTGLEIGFCWGMSAWAYLMGSNGTLLSIDLDDNKGKEGAFRAYFPDRWEIKYGDSVQVLSTLTDKYDWVYVDGDHSYEGCKRDLEAVDRLAREYIVCDDYGQPFGAKKAIDEFVKDKGYRIEPVRDHINGAVIIWKK